MRRPPLHNVLYVEDDPQLRAVGRMALEVIGRYTVHDCCSRRSSLLTAADFEPDLILLDVQRSELDGLETLARLRRFPHLRDTPVLFVACENTAEDAAFLRAAGAIGVIDKPVEPMRLAAQLRHFWELHWSVRRRLADVVALPGLR